MITTENVSPWSPFVDSTFSDSFSMFKVKDLRFLENIDLKFYIFSNMKVRKITSGCHFQNVCLQG